MAFLMCTFAEDPYWECKLKKKRKDLPDIHEIIQ